MEPTSAGRAPSDKMKGTARKKPFNSPQSSRLIIYLPLLGDICRALGPVHNLRLHYLIYETGNVITGALNRYLLSSPSPLRLVCCVAP